MEEEDWRIQPKCILFDFHSLAERGECFYIELSNYTLRRTHVPQLLDISNRSEIFYLILQKKISRNISSIQLQFLYSSHRAQYLHRIK